MLIIIADAISSFLFWSFIENVCLDFLSIRVTRTYKLFLAWPSLPDSTVSASQCPISFLLPTCFGRFLIVLPMLKCPLFYCGLLNFYLRRSFFSFHPLRVDLNESIDKSWRMMECFLFVQFYFVHIFALVTIFSLSTN